MVAFFVSMVMRDHRSEAAKAWRGWYSLARWRKLRKHQLSIEPFCRMCRLQGRRTAATVCDHVERHNGDPEKFWGGPFQSLCEPHHNATKQAEEHRGFSTATGADGWPIDPAHPANR